MLCKICPKKVVFKKSAGQFAERTERGGLVLGLQLTSGLPGPAPLPGQPSAPRKPASAQPRPAAPTSCEPGFSCSTKPRQQQHPRLALGFLLGPKSFYARYEFNPACLYRGPGSTTFKDTITYPYPHFDILSGFQKYF